MLITYENNSVLSVCKPKYGLTSILRHCGSCTRHFNFATRICSWLEKPLESLAFSTSKELREFDKTET